jgi:hypothetical protein
MLLAAYCKTCRSAPSGHILFLWLLSLIRHEGRLVEILRSLSHEVFLCLFTTALESSTFFPKVRSSRNFVWRLTMVQKNMRQLYVKDGNYKFTASLYKFPLKYFRKKRFRTDIVWSLILSNSSKKLPSLLTSKRMVKFSDANYKSNTKENGIMKTASVV